jgi:hypothetical protein
MLEKLDVFAIRIYNWFIIKIVVTFLIIVVIILAILWGDRTNTIKELLDEINKFVLSFVNEDIK